MSRRPTLKTLAVGVAQLLGVLAAAALAALVITGAAMAVGIHR